MGGNGRRGCRGGVCAGRGRPGMRQLAGSARLGHAAAAANDPCRKRLSALGLVAPLCERYWVRTGRGCPYGNRADSRQAKKSSSLAVSNSGGTHCAGGRRRSGRYRYRCLDARTALVAVAVARQHARHALVCPTWLACSHSRKITRYGALAICVAARLDLLHDRFDAHAFSSVRRLTANSVEARREVLLDQAVQAVRVLIPHV